MKSSPIYIYTLNKQVFLFVAHSSPHAVPGFERIELFRGLWNTGNRPERNLRELFVESLTIWRGKNVARFLESQVYSFSTGSGCIDDDDDDDDDDGDDDDDDGDDADDDDNDDDHHDDDDGDDADDDDNDDDHHDDDGDDDDDDQQIFSPDRLPRIPKPYIKNPTTKCPKLASNNASDTKIHCNDMRKRCWRGKTWLAIWGDWHDGPTPHETGVAKQKRFGRDGNSQAPAFSPTENSKLLCICHFTFQNLVICQTPNWTNRLRSAKHTQCY